MRDQQRTGSFGAPARGIGMHVRAGKEGQFASGFGKRRDMGAQAHQRLLKPRGHTARQQAQFLIEGGKAQRHKLGRCHSVVQR